MALGTLLVLASLPAFQNPPPESLSQLIQVHQTAGRMGRELQDSLWRGFRPDTIPVLYVLPHQGTLLLGWAGPLPEGFASVPGTSGGWRAASDQGAASTGTTLGGKGTAQVVVREESYAALVGLTLHEAFHVFANSQSRMGHRFGQGENAFLVTSYPVFDPVNEAGMALEGRLLARALGTSERSVRQEWVHQFLAARESRHRRLGAELAQFEQLAELNEGLAEYILVRSAQLGLGLAGFPDRDGARAIVRQSEDNLNRLTEDMTRSIRLRFYTLGPAQARLLDQLAGPGWKARLMADDLTLQDALATASGYRDTESALLAKAEQTLDATRLKRSADSSVSRLKELRHQQVDSLLALPGLLLQVHLDSLPGRSVGLCGIDPQNLLQIDEGELLHTRWVQPCRGQAFRATFNTSLVQDNVGGTLRAVVGPEDSLRVMTGGQAVALRDSQRLANLVDLRMESARFNLRSARADLWREGRVIHLRVKE